jgi:hypothetical protein
MIGTVPIARLAVLHVQSRRTVGTMVPGTYPAGLPYGPTVPTAKFFGRGLSDGGHTAKLKGACCSLPGDTKRNPNANFCMALKRSVPKNRAKTGPLLPTGNQNGHFGIQQYLNCKLSFSWRKPYFNLVFQLGLGFKTLS